MSASAGPPIVLVTGGAGFIGSHLVDALLAAGRRVRVLDDLSTGRRENLAHASGVEFIEGSVASGAALDAVAGGVDCIFHLAAIASVAGSVADPEGTGKVNYGGTVAVLEAAERARARRVVFASSAAIYGDAGGGALREDRPADPQSPYGSQKWESELACAAFAREHGLETACLRFFNVFGSRQRPDSDYSGVISVFVDRAARGCAPVIYGDGEQTRDFVHVSDVVAGLIAAAERPGGAGAVVNIGTGVATSVNRVWAEIARIAGSRLAARHVAPRAGEVRHSLADPARAFERLGWRSRVSFADGLERLLAERGIAAPPAPSGHSRRT